MSELVHTQNHRCFDGNNNGSLYPGAQSRGRSPSAIMKTARQRTGMLRHARTQWPPSPRAGAEYKKEKRPPHLPATPCRRQGHDASRLHEKRIVERCGGQQELELVVL